MSKLKFCETARIQPAHARASIYSAIFNNQQITPEVGGNTPIAVGNLVVFNYVMTVGGPQRPTAGAAPSPSGS